MIEIICHWNENYSQMIMRARIWKISKLYIFNFDTCCTKLRKKNVGLLHSRFQFLQHQWKMAYLTPESESSTTADLSWTQLITPPDKPRATIVRISDDKPKEMNPDEVQLNNNTNENSHRPRQRRESLMGTFHRHLRQSLKAVSESPGPLTR